MAYPNARIELYLGGRWVDVTGDVYLRARINITCGRKDRASRPSPSRCRFYLKNQAAAKYSPVNPTGPYFGMINVNTPVRISVTPNAVEHYRFHGVIPSFPLERHDSDNDRWVAVEAFGPLYALQRDNSFAHDALRRHVDRNGALACWPLTDGEDARQGSEVIAGGQPMRAVGKAGHFYAGQPGWARGSLAPWHSPVVQLPASTEGQITGTVQPVAGTRWAADHFRAGAGGIEDDLTVVDTGEGSDADPKNAWIIVADRTVNQVRLEAVTAGETATFQYVLWIVNNPGIFDESPHMLRVTTEAAGTDTDWTLVIDGEEVGSGTHSVVHRPASRFRYRWGAFNSMAEPLSLGYITYWGASYPGADQTWAAARGHALERAGRRIERLCQEDGVPLRVVGDLDATPVMGPQQAAALMDLLGAAVEVDGGVLGEALDEIALEYRTTRSKCNQGVQ